ncbi:MAG: type II CAAX endopeptidase family protein [Actinomycetota bacterium]|nr:type II CAAX endopeptidase family protein [Actinomycetota bacterium]
MSRNQPRETLREVVIYFLWLALGTAISIATLFPAAFLIFHSKRVSPEAAALVFWPALILITFLRLRKFGADFSDIGLRFHAKKFLAVVAGTFIGALFICTVFGISAATKAILIKPQAASYSLIIALLIGFIATFIQSGTEELVFRGYLLKVLAGTSRTGGIVITAMLFSILHFWQGVNLIGWLNIFLFGVFAAQLFYLAENLWLPIGFHFGWNLFQERIFGFPVYGYDNLGVFHSAPVNQGIISGGSYGPEGSVIISIALTIAIYSIYRAARIQSNRKAVSIKLPEMDLAGK